MKRKTKKLAELIVTARAHKKQVFATAKIVVKAEEKGKGLGE